MKFRKDLRQPKKLINDKATTCECKKKRKIKVNQRKKRRGERGSKKKSRRE